MSRRLLKRSSRRLYSRVLLGLRKKGRYYFVTFTSSPKSPPVEMGFKRLRWYIKRVRPQSSFCYCLTNEGYGVIHMIIRLGTHEQKFDIKELRDYWQKTHKATQIKIKRVGRSEKDKFDLSKYISDQRKGRKLGGEMAWQDKMIRWRWSKGWLPKGFTRIFGKLWFKLQKLDDEKERNALMKKFIDEAFEND